MADNRDDAPPPGVDEYLMANGMADVPSGASSAEPEGVDDLLAEMKAAKYGSTGQMLKTAAEGLAEGIAGPLAPIAAEKFGISTEEDRQGRAEENPITKGTAEVGGLLAPALVSGGTSLAARAGIRGAAEALPIINAASKFTQAGLLESAGAGAAKAVGLAAPVGWIAKAGEGAVKGAVESAIFQGGKELSEAYLGDPSQVADHAIADMGLATVLGGVFGGAFGLAANALSKEGKALVSQADVPAVEAGDLKSLISADATLAASKKDGLLQALNIGKRKANAAGIETAATELGLPSTPGMLLDSPVVRVQLDALANSPYTFSGNRIRTQLDNAYEAAEGLLTEASHSANALSREEVGTSIVRSLDDKIRAAYAPQKAAYEELAALHQSIPVETDALEGLAKAFNEIKEVKIGNTQEGRLVREVLDLASNVKTAEDLTTIRNMASLKKDGVGVDPLGWLKGKIRDELALVQKDSIRRYSKSFPRNDEAGALFASKLEMADAAAANYAPYIKNVSKVSEWLGKGKIHGTEDALNFLNERLSPTDVAKRLFSSSKDPEFIKFFSKEFPEQFNMIRDYQRMELAEASHVGGALSPKKFFKKFDSLEPEVQKSLYTPEEIKKINKLNTYFEEAFPKNFNPSGTDHMRSLRSAMESPKGMGIANVRDYTMEKMIQLAEKGSELHNAHALGKATARGWKTAGDSVKAVFDTAKEIPGRVIPIVAQRDKLDKLVTDSVKNPERLYGINDNNPAPEYNEAFAGASARAVAYLSSLKPSTDPQAPLDSKNVPSKAQLATYHRALDIAQQPLITMRYLKEGSLTTQDVTSLRTIYPNLYNQMAQKLTSEMVNAQAKKVTIPYKTKMSLSLFLGQPLDSTLKGQSILAAQPMPAQQPGQEAGRAPAYNSVKGLDSLAKGARTPGQARSARDLDKN